MSEMSQGNAATRSARRRERRRGRAHGSPWLRRIMPAAIALFLLWFGGLVWFADDAARMQEPDDRRTDAIVVLTGGSERLPTGLDLLSRNRAEKLFVSGVYAGVEVAELLRLSRQAPEELACCIVLGYAAGDTRGNAIETAEWLRAEGYGSVRLVTSNYHMARSLLEFRRVLADVAILPHPVKPHNVLLDDWWRRPGTASLIVSEYNKFLVALLRYGLSSAGIRLEDALLGGDLP
jgi:uncharacterized SAM-binding protein YcdF (DUF218 family)